MRAMRIAVFGTGYVGLVTGTCLAEMGNEVTCVDVDAHKVARLRAGEIPIFEPGLHELLEENLHAGRLLFTTDPAEAVPGAEACFICVGTPMGADGHADLSQVEAVARTVGRHLGDFAVIVTKSTVPVGTAERIRAWVAEVAGGADGFAVAANPEFLKEGDAVDDFMKPDRVVLGVEDEHAEAILRDVYSPFIRNGLRLYTMDLRSAEMTKYASNCMLATKISFINEIANICEAVGADVRQVRQGVGADGRIGLQFLHPGAGFGGSCFPKDVRALIGVAESAGCAPELLHAVDSVNRRQKRLLFAKIRAWCELREVDMEGLVVAVWGLAFKPNTDDVREAPSLDLIEDLLAGGARVRAHDFKALENARSVLGERPGLSFHHDPYDATEGADVLALVTEWRPYRRPDFRRLAAQLARRTVFDGRNQYDEARLRTLGIDLVAIGARPADSPKRE